MWFVEPVATGATRPSSRSLAAPRRAWGPVALRNVDRDRLPVAARVGRARPMNGSAANRHSRSPTRRERLLNRGNTDGASASGHGLGRPPRPERTVESKRGQGDVILGRGARGTGHGARGATPCPMPHAPCPMPYAPCPMPHAPCPIPHPPSPPPPPPCLNPDPLPPRPPPPP